MLARKAMTAKLQVLMWYADNIVMVWLLFKSVIFCSKHSPIDSVSNIMKLCDYDVAKLSKINAYI